jgi:hypothetical protein
MVTFLETSPMVENNMRELYEIYLELGHELFDKFEVNNTLTQEKEIAESKNVLPNVIYDNSLDDGPILPDDINFATIVKSEFNNSTIFELNTNYVRIDTKSMLM